MPKTIQSPVQRFPGSVVLSDPLTYPQALAFEESYANALEVKEREGTQTEYEVALWPGLSKCIEKCDVKGIDINRPPASPRGKVAEFVAWLFTEILEVYIGDTEDPNA